MRALFLGFTVALAAIVTPLAATSAPAQGRVSRNGCSGFTGRWNTTYGIMRLTESGGVVHGSYDWNGRRGDTIEGALARGGVLSGTYAAPGFPDPKYRTGRVQFALSADGNSFDGRWTDARGNPAGAWRGTCMGR